MLHLPLAAGLLILSAGPALANSEKTVDRAEPIVAAESPPPIAATGPAPEPPKQKNKSETALRLRGRLQTGWQLNADTRTGTWSESVYVRRARIDGRWTPTEWVKLMLEMQLDLDGVEARDVYAEFSFRPELEATVGYFKKPFSRLRMMSPYDLLIPDRGLLDANVVRNTKYGGFGARDLGIMLSGAVEGPALWRDPLKLTYSAGIFNSLPNQTNGYRDGVVRAQLRLFKGLVVAANSSFKFYNESNALKTAAMWGGDVKWELGDFRLQVEGALGDNVNTATRLWGAHALAGYALPIGSWMPFDFSRGWILTPALTVEVYDPDIQAAEDLDLRVAAALNLDVNDQVRLVLSADQTWNDVQATTSTLPDPLTIRLQTNLRF
jgi:hypothetical protein